MVHLCREWVGSALQYGLESRFSMSQLCRFSVLTLELAIADSREFSPG
jgi:hypothetical protein